MARTIIAAVVIIVALIVGIPLLCFSHRQISAGEIRYYIMLFLFLQTVGLFGVLRLYNSTVMNTAVMARMIEQLKRTGAMLTHMATQLSKWKGETVSSRKGFSDAAKRLETQMEKLADAVTSVFKRSKGSQNG